MALIGPWASHPAHARQIFDVRTISNRQDRASGGDVLVQLSTTADSVWIAQLNGQDVTGSFRSAENSPNLPVLLTGLKPGGNTLEIRVDGKIRSKLDILDHPITGPIFSGPHQNPFICQALAFLKLNFSAMAKK